MWLQCAESAITARCVAAHSHSRQRPRRFSQIPPEERRYRPMPTTGCGAQVVDTPAVLARPGRAEGQVDDSDAPRFMLSVAGAGAVASGRAVLDPPAWRARPLSLAPTHAHTPAKTNEASTIALAVLWHPMCSPAGTRAHPHAVVRICSPRPPPSSHQPWPTALPLHVHATDSFGHGRTSRRQTKQNSARVTRNRAPGNERPELRGSALRQAAP